MDDSVTGIQPTDPNENDTNRPAEQNNASDEYEDTSPILDSCMSVALKLDDSAHLEQAFWKIYKNDGKMEERSDQICSTSSRLSVEKNISEMHKCLEKENSSGLTHYKASTLRVIEDLQNNLDAEIKERRKAGSELKLVQGNLEGMLRKNASTQRAMEDLRNRLDAESDYNAKAENALKRNLYELAHYKASTQQIIEELRKSLDAETKERRKAESELKLAEGNLEGLRRDKTKAENELKRPFEVGWLSITLIVLALLCLNCCFHGCVQ
ncbi:hypothetical protein DdX_20261 [Ditylenchus destructor]|uniref:Uncharacterized protein n=1 Tax=Ditylenchus destructor TaxID=166010 RepID=A0AAD4MHH7_9BILA|nr:hypothetical protein DdX_20261 [Ditylenchus destructor]